MTRRERSGGGSAAAIAGGLLLLLAQAAAPRQEAPVPPPPAVPALPVAEYFFYSHMFLGDFKEPIGVSYDPVAKEILVADSKNNLVGIFDDHGIPLFAFGPEQGIKEPVAVAADPGGRLYVLDAERDSVKIFSYRGEPLGRRSAPAREGRTPFLSTFALDPEGNLHLALSQEAEIVRLAPDGTERFRFGGPGRGEGRFLTISDIDFGPGGEIVVTDLTATPVQVFDRNGRFVRGFGKTGLGIENFSTPSGVGVDATGRIFVTDTLRQEIKAFTPEGRFLYRFGGLRQFPGGRVGYSRAPGEVAYPVDVEVTPDGRILVAEKVGGRVQIFREPEPVPR